MDTNLKEVKIYAPLRPSIEIIKSVGITLLIYYGGDVVVSNAIEFGVLYLFIDYLQRFFVPIMDLAEKYNILQASMAYKEELL